MTDHTNSPPQPARKRRRPAVVCAECRRRKIACDRKSPCGQCALHKVECIYVTGNVAPAYGRSLHPKRVGNPGLESGAGDGASYASANQTTGSDGSTTLDNTPGDDDGDAAANPSMQQTIASLGEGSSRFGGRLAKTRLFGRSHWMNNMDDFKLVHSLTHLVHFVSGSAIYKALHTCKRIARIIKTTQKHRIASLVRHEDDSDCGGEDKDAWLKLPPRAVADRLVDLYFNVFEPQFRILHMPTFRREYETYMSGLAARPRKGKGTTGGGGAGVSRGADERQASAVAHDLFTAKLVLVLALGSCFYDDVNDPAAAATVRDNLRVSAAHAVTQRKNNLDIAYCTPRNKHRLTFDTLQVYCLVTVARQTDALALGDDLGWFTAGGLLHTACGMGLNCDPSQFKSLSFAQAEMRRRLWATILELVVQASLDQGMPPLISSDDYDCAPPHNLNDDDFDMDPGPGPGSDARSAAARESNAPMPSLRNSSNSKGHPDTVFTHSSLQRLLYRSLPTRLTIAKALNGLGAGLTYERALHLSQELLEACRYTAPVLRSAALNTSMGGGGGGGGQQVHVPEAERAAFAKLRIAFYEMLTRRFHHSLHSPFARKAGNNVQFYFSRRARVETVLRLISFVRPSPLSSSSPGVLSDLDTPIKSDAPITEVAQPSGVPMSLLQPTALQDPCRRLWIIGRGLLECTIVDITATAIIEMIHQLQEDHFVPGTDLTLSQRELYDTVRTAIDLSHTRIEAGETNVKAYLFSRGALAQADALMAGKPVRQAIIDAVEMASKKAITILRGLAARRGVALPDNVDDADNAQRDAGRENASNASESPTISPVVLQTDVPGAAAEAARPSAFAGAGAAPPSSGSGLAMPVSIPRLPSSNSFNSLVVGGGTSISTPSQILGLVDLEGADGAVMGGLAESDAAMADASDSQADADADADSGIQLSSAATTDISSGTGGMDAGIADNGQGWADDWIMDPQGEFRLDNWFFPYSDRINYG